MSKFSNEDIRDGVRKCYSKIAASIDPKGYIVDKLFEREIITTDQMSRFREHKNANDRTAELLQILFSGFHPDGFIVFREALKKEYPSFVKMIDSSIKCKKKSADYKENSSQTSSVLQIQGPISTGQAENIDSFEEARKGGLEEGTSTRISHTAFDDNRLTIDVNSLNTGPSVRVSNNNLPTSSENSFNTGQRHRVSRVQESGKKKLCDLVHFIGKKGTPEIVATLVEVGEVIPTPYSPNCESFFDTYLDDESCPRVRAVVFKKEDKECLHDFVAEMKGKLVRLKPGSYRVKFPDVKRSNNAFEIGYFYIPEVVLWAQ